MLTALLLACASPLPPHDTGAGAITDTGPAVARGALSLALPLVERELFEVVVGVDHDPTVQGDDPLGRATCTDYLGRGFPHCYDEHDGSDYILHGGFSAMDDGSATIIAALGGTVIAAEDGHYDRCHGSLETGTVDCDGHSGVANSVILEHDGGYRTLYWHMKQGSVAVQVGQQVEAGETLGLVGSSGYSSQPHLHFELQDPDGQAIDPYAGPYSQPETWWCEQGPEDGLPGACG